MIRYKLLKDCKPGDWVYYGCGDLNMVKETKIGDKNVLKLTNGIIETWPGEECKVYLIDLHTKIIADIIHKYYHEMHEKKLIHGSKWVNWLSDKFDELMELDDNATREDYQKIYCEIVQQIRELEYHTSFLR